MRHLTAIIFCFLIGAVYAVADEQLVPTRFILIQTQSGSDLYELKDGSEISVLPNEELLLLSPEGDEEARIDLTRATGFGVVTREVPASSDDVTTGAVIAVSSSANSWLITTLDGIVVSKSESAMPDISGLEKGRIYIITNGNQSFKYLAL